ncbi:hypothetical protein IscW_ISCW008985 [Ixodes scapularis]|uniref:Uncharacterized protein n=1 Tax=Ixodes scapularis TaxID=6945 RepID=B7Q3F8_IXOSC|nr:hypothetical protein IscW_ISCW008985 [Ixodes scapularis]|eukprot:XP_002411256.1 hypothetical protein IscW_ISCW008985 [Ixodes scapularis]
MVQVAAATESDFSEMSLQCHCYNAALQCYGSVAQCCPPPHNIKYPHIKYLIWNCSALLQLFSDVAMPD